MNPLMFVRWWSVAAGFKLLLWLAALVLALIVLAHVVPPSAPVHCVRARPCTPVLPARGAVRP